MVTFGEKLYKLRKEKGYSQEDLAEKLKTTRQAISKWENGQGYPETEKLLIIGNIFDVPVDYLLKDTVEQRSENEEGYYVSKEMAEGFLFYEHKTAKYIALGLCLLILSTIPYLVFKQDPAIYSFLIIIIAAIGIGTLVKSAFVEDDGKYKVLKKEALLFDQSYIKELAVRYESLKKKYAFAMAVGVCLLGLGALSFLLEKKDITLGVLVPYYPVSVVFIAIGAYILIRTSSILEAYKLLVKNEEHVNKLGVKLQKKIKKRVDDL